MYDTSAKRRKHHADANQQPADHNDRSAAIAIDQNAAQGACRDDGGGETTHFFGTFSQWSFTLPTEFSTDLQHT